MIRRSVAGFLIVGLLTPSFAFADRDDCNFAGGTSGTSRLYAITDSQGSVRLLTDSTGAIVRSNTYTPYGTVTTSGTSAESPYLYTGENLDPETNLIYLRARYYDPATGRFISRDPVRGILTNPMTQNPYIYAAGNPMMYSDPSGEFIPLLLLGWAAVELGLTIWDGYDTLRTVSDDCATSEDKALALALFTAGLIGPGAGYGKADDVAKMINNGIQAQLKNGFYEVNGFKFTKDYYEYLWNSGRKAPSLIAKEILDNPSSIVPDPKDLPGYFKYTASWNNDWYLIYNPSTGHIKHLGP